MENRKINAETNSHGNKLSTRTNAFHQLFHQRQQPRTKNLLSNLFTSRQQLTISCDQCEIPETVEHVIEACTRFTEARRRLKHAVEDLGIITEKFLVVRLNNAVFSYIRSSYVSSIIDVARTVFTKAKFA